MYRLVRFLVGLGIALVVVTSYAPAQAATYNVITGTDCNDWSEGVHEGLGEPENTGCQRDDLDGTKGADKISGKALWDYITSGGGNDFLIGNKGMDAFYAGSGDDIIKDVLTFPVFDPENHDHAWGGPGSDTINLSDGYDEPAHKEEAHGDAASGTAPGVDKCILDNDTDDIAQGCEQITVVNSDGSTIGPFSPGSVPSGVNITVRP